MANSETFQRTCDELAKRTSLEALEARGTVRIALKAAGLEPASVNGEQMAVVLERVMPTELEQRGVEDAQRVCQALVGVVRGLSSDSGADSPESVFKRLGGSA